MLDKQQRQRWNRMVKKLCREIAKEFGFVLYRPSFLAKVENDIAQIICFDFPPMGMRLHVAVQPLYVQDSSLSIGFGYDIKKGNFETVGKWGSVPERMEDDIAEIYSIITQTVFPLFSSLNTPSKIVDFFQSGRSKIFFPFPSSIRYPYWAFSLMREGEYDAAVPLLNLLIDHLSQYSFPSAKKEISDVVEMIELIHARRFTEINAMLEENVTALRTQCGI